MIFSRFPEETMKTASACRRKPHDKTFKIKLIWYKEKSKEYVNSEYPCRVAGRLLPASSGNRE